MQWRIKREGKGEISLLRGKVEFSPIKKKKLWKIRIFFHPPLTSPINWVSRISILSKFQFCQYVKMWTARCLIVFFYDECYFTYVPTYSLKVDINAQGFDFSSSRSYEKNYETRWVSASVIDEYFSQQDFSSRKLKANVLFRADEKLLSVSCNLIKFEETCNKFTKLFSRKIFTLDSYSVSQI